MYTQEHTRTVTDGRIGPCSGYLQVLVYGRIFLHPVQRNTVKRKGTSDVLIKEKDNTNILHVYSILLTVLVNLSKLSGACFGKQMVLRCDR